MAISRREYIFGAFLLSVLCSVLVIVSLATDSWVVTETVPDALGRTSNINYGLFVGELVLRVLVTPTTHTIHMTCVLEVMACAQSCKTSAEARKEEVRALAEGRTPLPICTATTSIDGSQPLREDPAVISFIFYIFMLLVLVIHLLFALIAAGLAILNATKNPTEPVLGVPGVRWANIVCAGFGLTALIMWGTYWAATDLNLHLAFAYTAVGELIPVAPALGFSYWILLGSVLSAAVNVVLVEVRRWHLERDPEPPTISIENHSDGTIFLY